jgi:GNAT superfamily N-acetyltransferase
MDRDAAQDSYIVTTETDKFDVGAIHDYLSNHSYWCPGIAKETVAKAVRNSIGAGAFDGDRQVGFARVVTDKATFAWICDVYVLPGHTGKGLAKRMLEALLAHPELQGLRRWMLATSDAHDLYRRVGFVDLQNPEKWMIIHHPLSRAEQEDADG